MTQKTHKTYTVAYRRKREGKTDYKKRLRLLLAGKTRLVIRKSLKSINAQIVNYDGKGDKVIAAVNSTELKKIGWSFNCKNTPSAYLVGLIIAKKAREKGVKEAILDIGLNKSVPGSKVYAVLKGAIDNGLSIPHSKEILPDEKRISGKHIEEYAAKLPKNDFDTKFSGYLKDKADPAKIRAAFDDIKNKIIGV